MSTECYDKRPEAPRDPIAIAGDLVRRGDKLSIEAANRLAEVARECDRLWRIAVVQSEHSERMAKEIEALGTATPEACRAIDAWNHRLDKLKAMEEFAELRRMVRTAQDASVIAINERRQFENENSRLSNHLIDLSNKLAEWQELTGCTCPSAAETKMLLQEKAKMAEITEKTSGQEKLELRACVERFAQHMEHRLRENDHKIDWPRPTHTECVAGIMKNLQTLFETSALNDPMCMTEREDADRSDRSAADAANFMVMMLGWDVNSTTLNRRD